MAKGRRYTPRPSPPEKPTTAAAGASHVRAFMLKLYDREDGEAADWPLIAETLFAVAFDALDKSRDKTPDDPRNLAMLRRVNAGSYDRLAGPSDESKTPLCAAQNSPSITSAFKVSQPGQPEPGK